VNRAAFVPSQSSGSTPIHVLMADPDATLPPVYREPLQHEGFELGTAVSGLECIARLRERAPDVLVLEPHMPWGGGDGVLAIMGESPELATVPVMILTSCRDPYVLKGVEGFPISDYYVKPLPPDRLAGRIRSLLGHPRLRFALKDANGRLECAIARRTGGRVQDLRVEVCDGRVIMRGRTESYHVKQLVLAAVFEALEASALQGFRIESEIEVDNDYQSPFAANRVSTAATERSGHSAKAIMDVGQDVTAEASPRTRTSAMQTSTESAMTKALGGWAT